MNEYYEHWDAIARGEKERLGELGENAAVLGWMPHLRVARTTPRKVLRVVSEPHVCGVGQYLLYRGVNLLVVYEDELRDFRRATVTPEETAKREAATRQYEIKLKQHAKARGWIEGKAGAANEETWERAEASFGGSAEQIMSDGENGTSPDSISCSLWTGWSPIISLEVLGDAPPPETNETIRRAEQDRLVSALQGVTGMTAGPDVSALMRRIDELEAKLAKREPRAPKE